MKREQQQQWRETALTEDDERSISGSARRRRESLLSPLAPIRPRREEQTRFNDNFQGLITWRRRANSCGRHFDEQIDQIKVENFAPNWRGLALFGPARHHHGPHKLLDGHHYRALPQYSPPTLPGSRRLQSINPICRLVSDANRARDIQ